MKGILVDVGWGIFVGVDDLVVAIDVKGILVDVGWGIFVGVGDLVAVMDVGVSFSGKQATKKITPSTSNNFNSRIFLKYIILVLGQTLGSQIRSFLLIMDTSVTPRCQELYYMRSNQAAIYVRFNVI